MTDIDLRKSIYQLTEEHPDMIDVLKDLGFAGIAFAAVRSTIGRTMTLLEGCRKQGKDVSEVINHLTQRGYRVINQ